MNDETFAVRDRRAQYQFTIHNRVVDEWLPIIGQTGYALYSLYVRMSRAGSEHCYPGFALILRHLGISRGTLVRYNRLLELCSLIGIEHGNFQKRIKNTYFIQEPPEVTAEVVQNLAHLLHESDLDGAFLKTISKRLESWQPLYEAWQIGLPSKPSRSTQYTESVHSVNRDGLLSKPEQEQITRTHNKNNNKDGEPADADAVVADDEVYELLSDFGVALNRKVKGLAPRFTPDEVQRVISAARASKVGNKPGLVVAMLERGEIPEEIHHRPDPDCTLCGGTGEVKATDGAACPCRCIGNGQNGSS